jgi:hypothetical protein
MHDAEKLNDLELHLPITGKTNADQDYEIQRSVRDIMQDLAHDKNLNPETMNKKDLMRMDLDPKTIDELMKLKHIYIETKDGAPVDAAHIRSELEDVKNEIVADAEHKRAEDDILKTPDSYVHKMHDAEKLKDLEVHLPQAGLTTADQDYEIQRSCRDIMRDLAGDPDLNPEKVTKKDLWEMNLDPTVIDEILKLKHIYLETKDGKPLDIGHLRSEIDSVMAEIENDAEHNLAEDQLLKEGGDYEHKMNDAKKIHDVLLTLPDHGQTTEDQDYQIQHSVRDIMRDLAHDDALDPHQVTRNKLMLAGFDENEILEIMKLKKIYEEVENGQAVDIDHLRDELGDVMDEIRKSAEVSRFENLEEDVYHHKMHDAELLKELAMEIPKDQTKISQELRNRIQQCCDEITADLSGDDTLRLKTVTRKL